MVPYGDLYLMLLIFIWFVIITSMLACRSLTTISTLALPSVPSSSLVVIVIMCTALAIPVSSIGLLFTVEWLL